jgi:glucokinase-like ROK family protein
VFSLGAAELTDSQKVEGMPRKGAQVETTPPDKPEQRELSVLQLIHSGANDSRLDVARKTGLSAASITAMVRELMAMGLVVESEAVSSSVGRKPIPLKIRGDAGYVIGLDIGSFYTRVVVTDLNGLIAYKHRVETGLSEGRVRVLRRVFEAVHSAIRSVSLPRNSLLAMGVAHSGVIDAEKGMVLSYPRPGQMAEWKNVPLQSICEQEFKLPCRLEDSVRMRAAAEQVYGLGRKVEDFLYIDAGMGIGAAIYFAGKLYRGGGGKAGEFGHITVDEDGPLCSCGNNGCLESVASCAAIIQAVRVAMERGVDSKIRDLAKGDLEQVSIEVIARAAAENDSLAFRVLREAASYIALGLADLVNLLNPRLIVFGGSLFRAAPQLLIDPIRGVIRQRALEKSANDVELLASPLGEEAGALGAARMSAERALENLYLKATRKAKN